MLQQNNTKHIEKTQFSGQIRKYISETEKTRYTKKKRCFHENAAIEMLY